MSYYMTNNADSKYYPKLIMAQTCNYKMYYQNIIVTFLKNNENMQNVLQSGGHLECIIFRPYIKLLNIRNAAEGLKYSFSAHKSKHNR